MCICCCAVLSCCCGSISGCPFAASPELLYVYLVVQDYLDVILYSILFPGSSEKLIPQYICLDSACLMPSGLIYYHQ